MSFLPLSFVRANKTLRKRLTLSFPKAVDCRVMVLELPNHGHLSFGVEAAGEEFELVMESFDESLERTAEQPLATFAKREDAMKALGKVRRALTRPLRRALGWLFAALLLVFILDWAQGALRGASSIPMSQQPTALQAPGAVGGPPALTPGQITALQQSLYAQPPGSQPIPQAGVPGLPTQPPAVDSAAPAPGQSGAPAASLYQNPNQPQDPTGGALSQLSNSR